MKYGLIGVLAVVVLVIAAVLLRNVTTQTATTIQPVASPTTPAPRAAPVAAASVTPSAQPAAPQPVIAPVQSRTADIPSAATPAFDCSKSHAPDELAICRNGQLSYLDQELNVLFDGLRGRLDKDQQAMLWAQEQVWLKQRGACVSDFGCIRDAYQSRIAQLQSWH
jgi:uncharacterized protein YecT (DUF1311 family)